jgi:hypothetical protein
VEDLSEQEVCIALKRLYDETESNVKTEAKIRRAYVNKVSEEVISEKVDNQLNSIKAEIYRLNPNFREGSKNYDKTKEIVTETITSYEKALIDLGSFYDGKIEQLILKKVELEAGLIGSILNDEYLYNMMVETENTQKDDKVRKTLKENFNNVLKKFLKKKEESNIADPKMITKLIDSNDVAGEIKESVIDMLERFSNEKTQNKEIMMGFEKEIAMVNAEIDRVNERKKKSIYDAMEVGDKSLTTSIKRPRLFARITRFFSSRFNTAKVVENTIIDPLRLRIESFKNNELSNIQG